MSATSNIIARGAQLKAVLFDLDDTLFDHSHASRQALLILHAQHQSHQVDFEKFAAKHAELLEIFHARFTAGEVSLDQARAARMKALFESFGTELDDKSALQIAGEYRDLHQANRQLVPGARELLDALSCEYSLGIVTNNASVEQRNKLQHLGIDGHFKALAISEEVGVVKPGAQIYFSALDQLGCEPHEAVMIGDNLHADVLGAEEAGIAAVWFNRFHKSHTQHLEQIRSFTPIAGVREAMDRAHQSRIRLFKGVTHVLSALAS